MSSAEMGTFTEKVISQVGCGWIVDGPTDWSIKLQKVELLLPEVLNIKGRNGFEYAINNFSKSAGLKKFIELTERKI
jgi:hypothetical protein